MENKTFYVILTILLLSFSFSLTIEAKDNSINPSSALSTIELIREDIEKIETGDTFEVVASATASTQIDTIAIDTLEYNGDIIECIKVEQGNYFKNDTFWLEGEIKKDKVKNVVWGSSIPDTGEGVFVTYTFKAKTDGTTLLRIVDAGMASAGEDISLETEDLSVIVGSGVFKPMGTNDIPFNLALGIIGIIVAVIVATLIIMNRDKLLKPKKEKEEQKEEDTEEDEEDIF